MTKYIVTEIQVFADGTITTPCYAYADEPAALAKYYQILSAAAQSQLMVHSAILFDQNGRFIKRESFDRTPPPDISEGE